MDRRVHQFIPALTELVSQCVAHGLGAAVQTELARRGYYHGRIDGVIGFGSREAIRAFQEAQGLPATGLIDPALLEAFKLPAVPRVAAFDHGSVLIFGS